MDVFVVDGGARLEGEIRTSGSKNSALPALAACLLTEEPVVLRRIPRVRDIRTMEKLLGHIGAELHMPPNGPLHVRAERIADPEAPYDLVKTMRASSLVLGPLVARTGRARVSMPGGCAIGARPINLHVAALEQLGAETRTEAGYIEAVAPDGLRGTVVPFDRITVTGTEDVMMAAVLARGDTIIENAAREPEVADLAELLNKMGARVDGAGTSTIRIHGVARLHGAEHTIIPDRIEAGTFLLAAAITGGEVVVSNCEPEHLLALTTKMRMAGVDVEDAGPGALRVRASRRPRAIDIVTEEYPGFATDLQAQYMALMTCAEGISFITETIFENRFMHVLELVRMGANIRIEGRQAIVAGVESLSGAEVTCSDLRASASLLLAALVARGRSVLHRVYHMDRGYENIEIKLAAAGARIERTDDTEHGREAAQSAIPGDS
ncbi:MAG TPA: UDP-N-acetylglucosamine 1-carboxyvinyltransferase [Bryobacteraceae bacterium]|nr:UDP-N-acetylglucosamine 1-carboxyvinyltransferase [Bryobacteraceae bacterium]